MMTRKLGVAAMAAVAAVAFSNVALAQKGQCPADARYNQITARCEAMNAVRGEPFQAPVGGAWHSSFNEQTANMPDHAKVDPFLAKQGPAVRVDERYLKEQDAYWYKGTGGVPPR